MEWESRGQSVVAEYIETMKEQEKKWGRKSITGGINASEEM